MTPLDRSKTLLLALTLLSLPAVSAQVQNPIQAAKDAYNRAKQEAARKSEARTLIAQNNTAATAAPSTSATGQSDCCSSEAMKKYAEEASVLDIVGIRLGMTPDQAIAAVKAYNPALKIDIIKAPIQHPATSPVKIDHVPLYLYAHTLASTPNQGHVEDITILMTSPPTTPVVAEVSRFIAFHVGEPVAASTLLDGFHKKYGIENFQLGSDAYVWIYGQNGKLLTRVAGPDTFCMPSQGLPHSFEPGHEAVGFNLINTGDNTGDQERTPACVPYLYVISPGIGNGIAPNRPINEITTTISSGALLYNSYKALHQMLQAEADTKAKQQNDAASKRAGPIL